MSKRFRVEGMYVRVGDVPAWNAAKALAAEEGVSLSAWVAEAIKRELARRQAEVGAGEGEN